MATTTKKLDVFINARDNASRTFARVGAASDQLVAGFNRLKFAAAGALAGFFGVRAIRSTAQQIDELGKLSDILNISTQDLAGFQHAAQITGASTQEMNAALKIFVRRVGEAVEGTGEGRKGFEKLGISAQEVARMDTAAALGLVSDRIRELPTAAERAAAAYQVLGRQGLSLGNFLELGSEGINDLIKDAERLGLTLDRDAAAKVEAANDAVTRMGASFKGLAQTLAVQIAPTVVAVSDFIANSGVPAIAEWGLTFAKAAAATFIATKAMRALAEVQKLIAARQGVLNAMMGPKGWLKLVAGSVIAVGAYFGISKGLDAVASSAENAMGPVASINDQMHDLLVGMKGEGGGLNFDAGGASGNGDFKAVTKSAADLRIEVQRLSNEYADAQDRLSFLDKQLDRTIIEDTDAFIRYRDQFNATLELRGKVYSELERAQSQLPIAEKNLTDSVERTEKALRDQLTTLGKTKQEIEIFRLSAAGASEQQLENVKQLTEELRRQSEVANAQRLIDGLREQVDLFDKSRGEIELYRLAAEGATDAQLELAKALTKQLDKKDRVKSLQAEADAIKRLIETDEERFARRKQDLEVLRKEGLLTNEEFQRALDQMTETNRRTHRKPRLEAIEGRLLRFDPVGLRQFVGRRDTSSDPAHKTEQNTANIVKEQAQANTLLDDLKTLMDRLVTKAESGSIGVTTLGFPA